MKAALEEAMTIDGAVGVCLVDYQSGMTLGTAGGDGLDLEMAAAGNTEVVRSKMRVMGALGLQDRIEDMLITLGSQYHLIRMVKGTELALSLPRPQQGPGQSRPRQVPAYRHRAAA